MTSRISRIFGMLILFGIVIGGCKGSSTDPNGNTTHIDIGDSIPRQHSNYSYMKSQLDQSGNTLPGTISNGHFALIDTEGFSFPGKNNVYLIIDDGDSCYYSYENSSDVSVYLQNPDYFQNHNYGENTDEALKTILDTVFHNWITLPIATKKTDDIVFHQTYTLLISGDYISTDITAKASYIGDSSWVLTGGENITAKHCTLTITAVFDQVRYPGITITHTRDIWFVPKIGYIAKLITRTNVPYIQLLVIPTDTTSVEKILTSFKLL